MRRKRTIIVAVSLAVLFLTTLFFISNRFFKSNASDDGRVTVKLGVVGSIYEKLWGSAIENLKEEGINLELVQFSDFVTPNDALNNKEIDLNAFQFHSYLKNQVKDHAYNIEAIGYTYTSRMNLYSNKLTDFSEIRDKDVIAIPDDVVNAGRALKVLENSGILTLKEGAGVNPTITDIANYSVGIELKLLKANSIAPVLSDVAAAIIPINYALDYGLTSENILYKDDAVDDDSYWIVVAAQSDSLKDANKRDVYQKVVEAFQSEGTEKIFTDEFGNNYVKVGWEKNFFDE